MDDVATPTGLPTSPRNECADLEASAKSVGLRSAVVLDDDGLASEIQLERRAKTAPIAWAEKSKHNRLVERALALATALHGDDAGPSDAAPPSLETRDSYETRAKRDGRREARRSPLQVSTPPGLPRGSSSSTANAGRPVGYDVGEAKYHEPLNFVDYEAHGEYKPHTDGAGERYQKGRRVATMIHYCKTPTAGGATYFPNLDLKLAPPPNAALFFSYKKDDGTMDDVLTEHGGCVIGDGDKQIVTLWIREGLDQSHPAKSYSASDDASHQALRPKRWGITQTSMVLLVLGSTTTEASPEPPTAAPSLPGARSRPNRGKRESPAREIPRGSHLGRVRSSMSTAAHVGHAGQHRRRSRW